MNKDNYKLAIYASLIFYLMCFIFPAFYAGEIREPNYPSELLMMGWLGPLDGHFSWYANIFYLLSLIYFKKEASLALILIAAMLALSFLTKDEIIRNEGGGTSHITAYGIGYFLWVTSLIMLLVAKALYGDSYSFQAALVSISVTFILSLSIFLNHFMFSNNSQFELYLARSNVMKSECKKAKSVIYKTKNNVKSIYYENTYAGNYEKDNAGKWRLVGSGISVDSSALDFYEVLNDMHRPDGSTKKYVKFIAKSNDWKGVPEDQLASEISILSKPLVFPSRYNIVGATEKIIDNASSEVMAEMTYVFDPSTGTLCSDQIEGRHFDPADFRKKVINI